MHTFSHFGRYATAVFAAVTLGASLAFSTSVSAQVTTLSVDTPSATGNYLAGRTALDVLDTDSATFLLLDASNTDWDNFVVVQGAFVALATNGQIEDATVLARQLTELRENYSFARLLLGTVALKERRYASAIKELSVVPVENFVGIAGNVVRSWAQLGRNDLVAATEPLKELEELGLQDFLSYHRALQFDLANHPDAIPLMAKTHEGDPYRTYVVDAYVRMLANDGQMDKAKEVLRDYFAQGLADPAILELSTEIERGAAPGKFAADPAKGAAEIFRTLGIALSRDGSPDMSLMFLRLASYLNPEADDINLLIAQLYEINEQFDAANELYERISQNSPYAAEATVNLAENLDALGDRQEAIRRLGNIVAVAPDNIDARSALADKLRFDEQFERAAEHYSQVIEMVGGDRPRDWIYFYLRGICYERTGRWEEAESDFRQALLLNPTQPQVLNYLGYSWVDRGENLNEALAMIERAVRTNPSDGYIVDSLGWAFYKLGRYEEAVAILEQAARLSPNDPEINDHLGDAYWKVGRQREARFQWTIARDMDAPDGVVAPRSTAKLEDGLTEETEQLSS